MIHIDGRDATCTPHISLIHPQRRGARRGLPNHRCGMSLAGGGEKISYVDRIETCVVINAKDGDDIRRIFS